MDTQIRLFVLFVESYMETLCWSETDEEGNPIDDQYGPDDLSAQDLREAISQCASFWQEAAPLVLAQPGYTESQLAQRAGHEFALTRNHHGAGFWDGDWERGKKLTEISHSYGTASLWPDGSGGVVLGN